MLVMQIAWCQSTYVCIWLILICMTNILPHVIALNLALLENLQRNSGADSGGGSLFGGSPNFIKREKNMRACVCVKTPHFSTKQLPGPPFPKSCIRPWNREVSDLIRIYMLVIKITGQVIKMIK